MSFIVVGVASIGSCELHEDSLFFIFRTHNIAIDPHASVCKLVVSVLNELQQLFATSIRFDLMCKRRSMYRVHRVCIERQTRHSVTLREEHEGVSKFSIVFSLLTD